MGKSNKKLVKLMTTSMMCNLVPGCGQFAPMLMLGTLAEDEGDSDKKAKKAAKKMSKQICKATGEAIATELKPVKEDVEALKAEIADLRRKSNAQYERLNKLDPDNAPKPKAAK